MSSYQSVLTELDLFFGKNTDDQNTPLTLFYQYADIDIDNDVDFYLVYQSGNNEDYYHHIAQLYTILDSHFNNVYFCAEPDDQSVLNHFFPNAKILSSTDMHSKYLEDNRAIKIFIIFGRTQFSAKPIISGDVRYIVLDDYDMNRIHFMTKKRISKKKRKLTYLNDDSLLLLPKDASIRDKYGLRVPSVISTTGLWKNVHGVPTMGVFVAGHRLNKIKDFKQKHIKKFIGKQTYYVANFMNVDFSEPNINSFDFFLSVITTLTMPGIVVKIIAIDPQEYLNQYLDNVYVEDIKIVNYYGDYLIYHWQAKIQILAIKDTSEVISLTAFSGDYVFVSSARAMIDVISLEQNGVTKLIFFQKQTKWNKFISQYLRLAKYVCPNYKELWGLFGLIFSANESDYVTDTANFILEKGIIILEQMSSFNRYVIEYHNIENNLISMCLRAIFENTETKTRSKEMLSLYLAQGDFESEYKKFVKRIALEKFSRKRIVTDTNNDPNQIHRSSSA